MRNTIKITWAVMPALCNTTGYHASYHHSLDCLDKCYQFLSIPVHPLLTLSYSIQASQELYRVGVLPSGWGMKKLRQTFTV